MNDARQPPPSTHPPCPAATGETTRTDTPCGVYPDTAHRCRHTRAPHLRHGCLCGYEWLTLNADGLTDPEIRAILHPPRHRL